MLKPWPICAGLALLTALGGCGPLPPANDGEPSEDPEPEDDSSRQPDDPQDEGSADDSTGGSDSDRSPPADAGGDESGAADAGVDDDDDGAPADPGEGTQGPVCYDEPVFPDEPIDDLIAAYGGHDWKADLIAILDRRHPASGWLLEEQQEDPYFDQFSDSSSWTGMVSWLDTLSHEQTHLFNAYHAIEVGQPAALYVRSDLIYYLPVDDSPARSLVYELLAPEIQAGTYASTYLTGTQGDRGFRALLDEASCYLNEIAAVAPLGEHFPYGVSLRDGAPALLHFIQVYLGALRSEQPSVWEALHDVEVYRDALLTLWVRTHFFLELADAFPALGVNDDLYRDAMHVPAMVEEIRLFTGADVDSGPCYAPAAP